MGEGERGREIERDNTNDQNERKREPGRAEGGTTCEKDHEKENVE